MKRYTKGFTLIELLVVIAIIGILASVVLVSLNSARNKGKDARVISSVQQARVALESGYNSNGVYSDLFSATASTADLSGTLTTNGPGNNGLALLATDANSQGGSLVYIVTTNSTVGTATLPNVIAYAVYGKLPSTVGALKYFCIDSTGKTNPASPTQTTTECPTP